MDNKNSSQEIKCPLCFGTDITIFFEIPQVPIHCNLLWQTREEAINAPRGDLWLGFCRECSHIFNTVFKPELMEYTGAYENSLHFSSHFQSYAESIAAHLIDRYDLNNKDIVEIGCGRGDFLRLLCKPEGNRGIGFDPGYVPEQNSGGRAPEQITYIQDFYSKRYANFKADLVCCRHVLEHIQFPRDFLNDIRQLISNKPKAAVFFEVPNVLFTLRELGIWDLIYEHCSYFSSSSLSYLFTSCGFEVCDLKEMFDGQFLCLEAVLSESSGNSRHDFRGVPGELISDLAAFADKYRLKVEVWCCKLEKILKAGQRVVVWGAGSKGVTFLNIVKTKQQIKYVVDINPRKHGKYIAGSGQQIVPPDFLKDYQPEVVIIMNPIYQAEIQQIMDRLGLTTNLMCV